jgi:S-adenosylmethionine decarboxylase
MLLMLTHVDRVRKTAAVVQATTEPLIYRDLAPSIVRQRLVVEGTRTDRIDAAEIRAYLKALSRVCDMTVLIEPVTHRSDRFGWAGWVHWETSGAHFYAWDEPRVFFSVDIYTCKAFDSHEAVEFTRAFLGADEVVAKEF